MPKKSSTAGAADCVVTATVVVVIDRSTRLPATPTTERADAAAFDAALSGRLLDFGLLGRLLRWMRPYRGALLASTALILLSSVLQVLMPIVMSVVAMRWVTLAA